MEKLSREERNLKLLQIAKIVAAIVIWVNLRFIFDSMMKINLNSILAVKLFGFQ